MRSWSFRDGQGVWQDNQKDCISDIHTFFETFAPEDRIAKMETVRATQTMLQLSLKKRPGHWQLSDEAEKKCKQVAAEFRDVASVSEERALKVSGICLKEVLRDFNESLATIANRKSMNSALSCWGNPTQAILRVLTIWLARITARASAISVPPSQSE